RYHGPPTFGRVPWRPRSRFSGRQHGIVPSFSAPKALSVCKRARYDSALPRVRTSPDAAVIPMIRFAGKFPERRPRRLRRDDFSRRLVREHRVAPDDLIYPAFVQPGERRQNAVPSLPGVARKSIDLLLTDAERCLELAI